MSEPPDSGVSHHPDEADTINQFVCARNPMTYDKILSGGIVKDCNVFLGYDDMTALETAAENRFDTLEPEFNPDCIGYLLTCADPLVDINRRNKHGGNTAFHRDAGSIPSPYSLVGRSNFDATKLLIDFGGDRNIPDKDNKIPVKQVRSWKVMEILSSYFPSEIEKLTSQLECKLKIDALFKKGRFNQVAVDLRFRPIWEVVYPGLFEALDLGDLNMLQRTLPPTISTSMLTHLISICNKKGHVDLVAFLCDKSIGLSPFTAAVSNKRLDVCEILLDRGHSLNEEEELFRTLISKYPYPSINNSSDSCYSLYNDAPREDFFDLGGNVPDETYEKNERWYSSGFGVNMSEIRKTSYCGYRTSENFRYNITSWPQYEIRKYPVELFLYSGLLPSLSPVLPRRVRHDAMCVLEVVDESRTLSLISLLVHKFVLLDIDFMIEIAEILSSDGCFTCGLEAFGVNEEEIGDPDRQDPYILSEDDGDDDDDDDDDNNKDDNDGDGEDVDDAVATEVL